MSPHDLVRAIEAHGGRATLADLAVRTAQPLDALRRAILPALSLVGGHVAVDERGELIYAVDRRRRLPPEETRLQRFARSAYRVAQALFYAALSVVLVAYFVFYVVVLIALAVMAIAAAARGSDCDCDCDCGGCAKCGGSGCDGCGGCADACGHGSANGCGDTCFGCLTCGSSPKARARAALRTRQREARAIRRSERQAARRARRLSALRGLGLGATAADRDLGLALEDDPEPALPPFARAVHAYLFGPPAPPVDPTARERNVLAFLQAHDGRATATDAVALTGLPRDQADALLLSLAARYEGDLEVGDDGVIVYTFDRLLVSTSEDADVLAWVASRGHSVTVEELARHLGLPAAAARARLGHLVAATGARLEHGATTRAVFPQDVRAGLAELGARQESARDFTFAWERLARAPRVIGVPEGKRGWIVGFNSLNLTLAAVMVALYGDPETTLSALFFEARAGAGEAWLVAYLPFAFSLSVFLIPLARAVASALANRRRLAANLRRVALLGVLHALEEEDDRVSSAELAETLGISDPSPAAWERLGALLAEAARDLGGEADTAAPEDAELGPVYRFPTAHAEIHAVERARLEVDRAALALADIAFDTAAPP